MRKINTADVFAATRFISANEMREELKPIMAKAAQDGVSVEDIGIDGILAVACTLSSKRSEDAFYQLLAGIMETTPEEVAQLSLDELGAALEQISEENDIKRFFGCVSRILGKKSLT